MTDELKIDYTKYDGCSKAPFWLDEDGDVWAKVQYMVNGDVLEQKTRVASLSAEIVGSKMMFANAHLFADATMLLAQCKKLEAQNAELREALEEIQKGDGAYSENVLQHAANTIENMVDIATKALKRAKGEI